MCPPRALESNSVPQGGTQSLPVTVHRWLSKQGKNRFQDFHFPLIVVTCHLVVKFILSWLCRVVSTELLRLLLGIIFLGGTLVPCDLCMN